MHGAAGSLTTWRGLRSDVHLQGGPLGQAAELLHNHVCVRRQHMLKQLADDTDAHGRRCTPHLC